MTNRTENSRSFQIFGKKDNTLSIYLILYRKFRLNRSHPLNLGATSGSNFDLSMEFKQWSLDGLHKKDTTRPREQICLPVDNWPLFPPCQGTFVTQRSVRTFNVSMAFWPRVFRNFRSEPTWKKIFLANVIRLQSWRGTGGREPGRIGGGRGTGDGRRKGGRREF